MICMALVYAALGMLAALLGGNLQALLQQPWLLGSFAALFVVLALPMFGFFELQLPAALRDRLEQAGSRQRGGSLVGAGVLGALSGLLVGPCMTAPLAVPCSTSPRAAISSKAAWCCSPWASAWACRCCCW